MKETIEMWLARDKTKDECFSDLYVGRNKPAQTVDGTWVDFGDQLELPTEMFPQVTYQNSPVKVNVTIEIEK